MVIDTGIFIDYLRASNKSKTALFQLKSDQEIYVSPVTVYELYMGATDSVKHEHVSKLLDKIPILEFNEAVAIKSAEIYHMLRKRNEMIDFRDIFIGATAIVYELALNTLNKKHFQRISGLQLV